MQAKTLFIATGIAAVLAVVVGCTEPYKAKLDTAAPRLVVDGWITNKVQPYQVRLSRSTAFNSNAPVDAVTGAVVVITDDSGGRDTLAYTKDGYYKTATNHKGIAGVTYTLTVLANGQSYRASCLLKPLNSTFDSLSYVFKKKSITNDEGYYASFNGQEPGATTGDAYRWILTRNDTVFVGSNYLFETDDQFINGRYLRFEFDGKTLNLGDTVSCDWLSLTREAYTYWYDTDQLGQGNGNPYAPIPANPLSNVHGFNGTTGDALGFFGASEVQTKTIIIK